MNISLAIQEVCRWLLIALPFAILAGNAPPDIVISTIVILFLVYSIIENEWSWLEQRWVQFAVLLWIYMMLRSIFTDHVDDSLSRSVVWGRYPLFAVAAAYWLLPDKRTMQAATVTLSVTVVFLVADTLLQYFTGADLFGRKPIFTSDTWRLTGPFSRPKVGIMIAWLAFPMLIYFFLRSKGSFRNPQQQASGMVLLGAFVFAVFASGERMALLLSLLGIGLSFLLLPINWRWKAGCIIAGIAGVVLLITLFAQTSAFERQYQSTKHVISHFWETPYGLIWQSAGNMIAERPVFGFGSKGFRTHCQEPAYGSLDNLESRCNLHPHNLYIEWLVEQGIIGLGLFLAMMMLWGKTIMSAFPKLRYHPLFIGLLIALILRLWPIAATTSFHTNWAAIPFWLYLGWLFALIERNKKES
jgi:O-antigen ligase